jgi:hypothetical protein
MNTNAHEPETPALGLPCGVSNAAPEELAPAHIPQGLSYPGFVFIRISIGRNRREPRKFSSA